MSTTYSHKLDESIDKIFADILGDGNEKLDHYQVKIDFAMKKIKEKPQLLGYRKYKLHVAQALLDFYGGNLSESMQQVNLADSTAQGNKIEKSYDEVLSKITHAIQAKVEAYKKVQRVAEARGDFVESLLYSLGLLALGGIVTGITYSLADPGGTYIVTSGLFLVGGIYVLVAIWRLVKWIALAATSK